MSDTDVYRLLWRYETQGEWDDWHVCPSREHKDGLYISLRAAKNSLRQQPHEYDYKIQKLGISTHSKFENGLEVIYLVELKWVDVDA